MVRPKVNMKGPKMAQIAVLEGYKMPRHRKRRRARRRSGGSQRRKLATAARKCKGKKIGAFRACIRKHLKKR